MGLTMFVVYQTVPVFVMAPPSMILEEMQ
jgi:hypothetical protein